MQGKVISYIILLILVCTNTSFAKNYYVNPVTGNDQYPGTTPSLPFQNLDKLTALQMHPGDSILLSSGAVFYGSLELKNVKGRKGQPIVVSTYHAGAAKAGEKAQIKAQGKLNGVLLENCSFVELENLQISAEADGMPTANKNEMCCGLLVRTSRVDQYAHIHLRNLHVENVFYEKKGFQRGAKEVKTANGSQNYGWGIRFINTLEGASIEDIKVQDCLVKNVAHTGIKFTGKSAQYSLRNIEVENNKVMETGGPGIQMSGVEHVVVRKNIVDKSGSTDDTRKWGRGSGLWTWGSNDVLIEKNRFVNANGPGDSAGAHIDYNCSNIVLQYNFSANNAGGFCEILGNNYNCAYRYNISVNDGHRVKGEKSAFQEGKIFWLSGYNGKRKRKGPFNSYFYNNTIFVKKAIHAKIAIDKAAEGVLIANNIFCIQGESSAVLGDQYRPEKAGMSQVKNVVFRNNMYLKAENWPGEVSIQDESAIYANPKFKNPGGSQISDYLPMNSKQLKNKGIQIQKLPGDTIGLLQGLKLNYDILGNKITGMPDLGAIEIK